MKQSLFRILCTGFGAAALLLSQPAYSADVLSSEPIHAVALQDGGQIPVNDFRTLVVSGAFNIFVTQSSGKPELRVEGTEDWNQYMKVITTHETLTIHRVKQKGKQAQPISLHLTVGDLSQINLNGAVNVEFMQEARFPSLNARVSGASRIVFHHVAEAGSISLTASGASKIEMRDAFTAGSMDIVSTGSSYIEFQKSLNVQDRVSAIVSGASLLKCTEACSAGALDLSVTGSSKADFHQAIQLSGSASMTATGSSLIDINKCLQVNGTVETTISGASLLRSKGGLKVRKADLTVTAASKLVLSDMQVESLRTNAVGGSDAELSGSVQQADYTVAGNSRIAARQLKAERVKVHVSGSGLLQCHAENTLEGYVHGGHLQYCGNPQTTGLENTRGKAHKVSCQK